MNMAVVSRGVAAVLVAAVLGSLVDGCATHRQHVTEQNTLSERSDRLITELDNGLVIIAQEIPTAPVVSVQSWVRTGSVWEGEYNGSGISHFLEHLVSGGTTTNRTEAQSNQILGRIGAQTNAATSLDTVRYYVNTNSEHTETAVELVSDWMLNFRLTEEEFERERDVIQREFEMGDSEPGRILWKLTQQARYQQHPARHPTIGYIDEFLEITPEQVWDFYQRMYVPNNMTFVVAGDIDAQAVTEQVRQLWADAEPGRLPATILPREQPPGEPVQLSGEADIERPRIRIAWPGTRLGEEHDYAMDLLGRVLGQGELSRLARTVRDEQGLATSVSAYNLSFPWGEGFFGIDATVRRGEVDEAREAILAQVQRIRDEGVTQQELERAKRLTVAAVVYASQTAEQTASRQARDFFDTGDPDYLQRYADAIEEVTAGEVMAAARELLRPKNTITVSLRPLEGEVTPITREPVEQQRLRPAEVELVELGNHKLVQRMRELEGRGHEARPVEVGPMRMHVLDNGLRVITQRNTHLPLVATKWYHLGGLLSDEPGNQGVANAMMQMLRRGAGDMTSRELAGELEMLGAQMESAAGNSTFFVNTQSLAGDWRRVLEIKADVIQRPRFDEDEWERVQPRLLAAIESLDDQWSGELRNNFRREFFGEGHPWASPIPGHREVVEDLTVDALRDYHAARFSADQSVLAIFGDIDEDEVVSAVRELFADLPAEAESPFALPETPQVDPRVVQVQTSKPISAVQIGYAPGIARQDADYPAMLVMDRVMSSFPVGRFDRALRGEGPGLVYAVGSGLMTGVTSGYWAVLFNTQSDTLAEAMQRSLAEVDRVRTEAVDEATLERARTAVLTREALSMQSNSQRATSAAIDELYGVGYDEAERLIEHIRNVQAEDVHRVARQYLRSPVALVLINEPVDDDDLPTLRAFDEPVDVEPEPAEEDADIDLEAAPQPTPSAAPQDPAAQ